ncbi:hypothetical protein SETIT_4G188900v2 [Setaria italica]|uniref:Uncharacterized protein n=1 Tax=Setaria italica TaxID=4555 RepID=A0A368QXM5_SETIT|nr:hypothetical protein SETIT_4G188900v2 [Setaria italica]
MGSGYSCVAALLRGPPAGAGARQGRGHRHHQPHRHVRARLQPPQRIAVAGTAARRRHLPPERGGHGDARRDAGGDGVGAAGSERAPCRRGATARGPRREAHPLGPALEHRLGAARGRAPPRLAARARPPRLRRAADAVDAESAVDTQELAADACPSSSDDDDSNAAPHRAAAGARRVRRCRDARKLAPCTLASQAAQRNAASAAQCTAAGAPQSSQLRPAPGQTTPPSRPILSSPAAAVSLSRPAPARSRPGPTLLAATPEVTPSSPR